MTFPLTPLISSPIIGGVFSSPAVHWPNTLGKLAYLRDHPYFLPCFIPSVIALVAFLGALVGLKEVFIFVFSLFYFFNYVQSLSSATLQRTREEKKPRSGSTSSTRLLEGRDTLRYHSIEDNMRHCGGGSSTESEIPQLPPLRALLTPRVSAAVINHGIQCFCSTSAQVLVPLMWSTSLKHGGLGFTPYTIGLALGIYGVVNVSIQVMLLGRLIRRFGPTIVFIVSFAAFLVSLSCFPLERYLARHTGGADWRLWTIIMVHLIMDSGRFYSYSELDSS